MPIGKLAINDKWKFISGYLEKMIFKVAETGYFCVLQWANGAGIF